MLSKKYVLSKKDVMNYYFFGTPRGEFTGFSVYVVRRYDLSSGVSATAMVGLVGSVVRSVAGSALNSETFR